MAFARVQGHGNSQVSSSTTFANVFTAPVASGNAVVGIVRWYDATSQTITSVSDDKGNTYNLGAKVTAGAGSTAGQIFWRGNITNAPQTVTVTMSAATQYFSGIVTEFSGVFAATDPKDVAPTGQSQANIPIGTTDGVTSGNITTVTAGCLIWGATDAIGGEDSPNAGTGFTLSDTYTETASAGVREVTEYLTQGAAGTIAATFTPALALAQQNTFVLALKPAVAAGPSLISPLANLAMPIVGGPRSSKGPGNRFSGAWMAGRALDQTNYATLTATDALDVAAFTGDVVVAGNLVATDAIDVAAFTGTVTTAVITGSLVATDATDVAAFTGDVVVSGSLIATDAKDIAAFTGTVGVSGTLAATDAKDVAAFKGDVVINATLVATDPIDTAAFDVAVAFIKATLIANEVGVSSTSYSFPSYSAIDFVISTLSVVGIDTAAFSGIVGVGGTLAATDAKDTASFTGTLPAGITGSLIANEVGINSTGYTFPANSAVNTLVGTLSVVGFDTAAFSGVIGVSGTLVATDIPDTASFSGQVIPIGITGNLVTTDTRDIAAFSGTAANIIGVTLAATDAKDIAAFSGTPVIEAVLAATEPLDTVRFDAILTPPPEIFGVLQAIDLRDTAFFYGQLQPGPPVELPPGVEDAPAGFASWKFGQRFDRSLTRRFPWQPGR